MKVAFAIASLNGGGSQRTTVNMANYWAARGRQVSILTLSQGRTPVAYRLDPRVRHHDLGATRGDEAETAAVLREFSFITRRSLEPELRRVAALRAAILDERPGAVIAMIDWTNVRAVAAAHGTGVPVCVSERSSAGRVPFEVARRETYRSASAVVALTREDLAYFVRYGVKRARAIPNWVAVPPPVLPAERGEARLLVSFGRLVPQKGYDILLQAFARIATSHPRWRLEIWGNGPLRPELEATVDRHALGGRAALPGFTSDPAAVFARADLYVQPSRAEGFPNALCEAMAHGLPIVASDCAPGVRAIVRNGVDGLLVRPRSVTALAAALDRLMSDDGQRLMLARRAPEIAARFSADDIMRQWEALLGA